MNATDERWAEPELHRLRGVLLEREGADAMAVERCLSNRARRGPRAGMPAWARRAEASLASLPGTTSN